MALSAAPDGVLTLTSPLNHSLTGGGGHHKRFSLFFGDD
jgi:hypothetical protein